MPLLYLLILAVVQGITEFLPISSSAHLELSWLAMGQLQIALPDDSQRLILFVAVHLGTLFAVLLYFWRDVGQLAVGAWRLLSGRGGPQARLLVNIVVGSLPLIAAGFLLKDMTLEVLYSVKVIAWATIGFGIALYAADRAGMTLHRIEHLTLPAVLVIGCAQVLALIPGTSRSGITMAAARVLGFERTESARISMLLALPAILGATALESLEIYRLGNLQLGLDAGLAALLAFASALLAIALMMAWLRRASFTPFVVYRIALGGFLLWLVYGGGTVSWLPF